jgi:malto-oligosyltrehalose trehalohydrolase
LLAELAERVRASHPDVHLILENEENEARWLTRVADRPRWYTAQWNDDIHHVLHVAATGEATGYYQDYLGDTAKLGRALAEGFAFQGEVMPYRGRPRGEPSAALAPTAFVAFIQNHDQIGNRAFGERLSVLAPEDALRAIAAVYLLCPQIPMLFMGEEWATRAPFPFFCDFSGDLADAVRQGRRAEFARFPHFSDPASRMRIPDPQADTTFAAAKLPWDEMEQPSHECWLAWYRDVIAKRRTEIIPRLARIRAGTYERLGDSAVMVRWPMTDNQDVLRLAANLSNTPVAGAPSAGRVFWSQGETDRGLGPWAAQWSWICE